MGNIRVFTDINLFLQTNHTGDTIRGDLIERRQRNIIHTENLHRFINAEMTENRGFSSFLTEERINSITTILNGWSYVMLFLCAKKVYDILSHLLFNN
ncbi:MAG: hypothetical protein K1060chlam4_00552 [Candidatus Anoxychlamydiales bacterium]|nr:hypothetical protein [Candidatus Anoxychlamydiales bacterium]